VTPPVPYKLVEVRWVDSHVDADWQGIDTAARVSAESHALSLSTTGYLIVDADDYVLVASSFAPMPSGKPIVGCTTQIPRCAIEKLTTVRAAPRAVAR
jgi:hypothetical protein